MTRHIHWIQALVATCALMLSTLLPATGIAQDTATDLVYYPLTDETSSYLMSAACPGDGMVLFFTLEYSQGGTLFDTCGIGRAGTGDWTLDVGGDGSLSFQIYSPNVKLAASAENGWCRYTADAEMKPGETYGVMIEIIGTTYSLVIYTQDEDNPFAALEENPLPCTLGTGEVWVGDFPGDDNFAPRHRPHRAAIAEIQAIYFGPVIDDFTEETLGQSWIIPTSGAPRAD